MSITRLQDIYAGSADTTANVVKQYTNNIQAGSVLFAMFGTRNGSAYLVTVSDDLGNDWQEIGQINGSNQCISVWYCVANSASIGAKPTVTFAKSSNFQLMAALFERGGFTSTVFDAVYQVTDNDTGPVDPVLSVGPTTFTNDEVLGFLAAWPESVVTPTVDSGFTETLVQNDETIFMQLRTASLLTTSTGTFMPGWSFGSSKPYAMLAVALKGSTTAPLINSTSPSNPKYQGTLTLNGVNFGASQGSKVVYLGGVAQTVMSWSDTLIVLASLDRGTNGFGQLLPLYIDMTGGVTTNVVNVTLSAQTGWTTTTMGVQAADAYRLPALRKLQPGWQIAYDTESDLVEVLPDGTVVYIPNSGLTGFSAQAWAPGFGWGRVATITLNTTPAPPPTPDIVDKTWGGLLTVNFDGFKDTLYPVGNRPAGRVTTPTIVGLSLKAGSFINGENGQGFPLSVFGYSLGTPVGLGTSTGTQFWFRDPLGDNAWHQASTYRYMKTSRVYSALELLELCIQPGNAAGFTPGHALDVSVTVNGVRTNVLVGAYVSQPGHVYFCSPAGNDGTGVVDDVTHPYRYAQFFNTTSNTYTGIWATLKPGDMICMRGNAGTWTDQVGEDGRFLAFPRPSVSPFAGTGTAPTGATGHGYITIMGYPGEDVHCSFTGKGGIQGCDSARAQAGWGQYVQVTNLRIDIGAGSDRDGAPINLQNGADHWIVTNNDCGPWIAGSSSFLNSSAIGGQGSNCYIAFNKCHDIEGLSDLQNHGMYFGGVSGGTGYDNASFNIEICYNWVFNCTGGSGIQFYWQGGNSKYMYGNLVHHNVVHDVAKYCLNIGESTTGYQAWDNVCWNSGFSIIRFSPAQVTGIDIRVEYNTFDAWDVVNSEGTPSAGVLMDGNMDSANGTVKFNHNILRMRQGRTGTALTQYWYTLNASTDTGLTASQNVYFDPMGQTTTGWSIDAQSIYGDPKFNNPQAGGDYSLQSGSPALAATTVADIISGVTTDIYGITRPGSAKTIGATEGVLT